jgi:ubiquinone/menaquinone biosynthesis C-methylase UbiE
MKPVIVNLLKAANALRTFFIYRRWRVSRVFDDWFEGSPGSETLRRIFAEAYGDDYAREADPMSFISLSDLERIAGLLGLGQGQLLVDLACGRGGPGLWIARQTGARLVGVDLSREAVRQAELRVKDFGLSGRARFLVGDFSHTGLPAEAHDGAICIDALFLSIDSGAAVREMARILRPGGRLVLSNWEGGFPTMVRDHRRLLEENGFEVDLCDRIRETEQRQQAVFEGIERHKNTLIKEMGKAAARVWIQDAKNRKYLHLVRRVLVLGRRKP